MTLILGNRAHGGGVIARLPALAEAMRAELGDDLTERKGSARREPGRVE